MSRFWISLGVVVLAGTFVWLLHRLRRKAKQTVSVATLAPFAEATRVRRHLAAVEQPALLATRLFLLATLAWLTWMPAGHDDAITGDRILAVTPGTPSAAFADFLPDVDRAVWLTQSLPPIVDTATQLPDEDSLAALISLDQQLAPSAALTVVGHWSAHEWPVAAPQWTRPIEFVGADTSTAVAFDRPNAIYLVGFSTPASAGLREVVNQWLTYPLAGEPVAVRSQSTFPDTGETGIWVIVDASVSVPPSRDWAALLVVDGATGTDALTAEVLWNRMTATLMREPPRLSTVTTKGLTTASVLPGRKTPDSPDVPIVWLALTAALFILERLLSAARPKP
ncbi:MAG: hypothetical protein AAGJ86_11050 [Pseudomonadota bacterium]